MKKYRKLLLAVLSSLLMTVAWPVCGLPIFIFFAFVPLLVVEHRIAQGEKGKMFWLAALTFLLWNVATTWWVWNASPAAVAAWLLNTIFMATVFWSFHLTKKKICNNLWGNLILIPYWMAFELLTYQWAAKWPWLNLGNVFSTWHPCVQWYEYTGIAGGTLWILLVNILFTNAFLSLKEKNKKKALVNCIGGLALILLPIAFSLYRYTHYEEQGEDVEVVVVQQNCDPWEEQFSVASYKATLQNNLNLAESMVTPNTRFVVSSESALQEGIWLDEQISSWSLDSIRRFLDRHPQTCYVIGATTMEWVPEGMEDDFAARQIGETEMYYFTHNSALLIDRDTVQLHNKSKLVPGVEAVPEWNFLKKSSLTVGIARGALKTDPTARNVNFDGHKIAVPICYESAFCGYVISFVKKGADLIFVITNDGWWGDTPGYKQHFEFSKLRAIENRRCVARSANTGRSGFFNQRGDAMQPTAYWQPAAIRETLKANHNITFYTQHGDYLSTISVYLTALLVLGLIVKLVIDAIKRH